MITELEKPVCLPELYSMGLQRIAKDTGVTENELLKKALDALFQQEMDADNFSAWEYLKESEAEFGPLRALPPAHPINPNNITILHEIRIAPEKIRRFGEED